MEERLQKIMSSCGITSRRQAEQWIVAGRVTVNQKVAQLGDKADLAQDEIQVDGRLLQAVSTRHYVMLHKPTGFVCTLSDEKNRRTVADLVADYGHRLWPVGRLDYMSEGLLIMTDDGDLTQKILHPSHEIEKEYLLWVKGDVPLALPLLSAPMTLEDTGETLAPAQVRIIKQQSDLTVLSCIIRQGKNRQLRRMCSQVGLQVLRLKRIREGNIRLDPQLPRGQWRTLSIEEISQITVKESIL